jgi:hypothetical protein
MSQQQQAFENLRVIRSLMERSLEYRALSAPAALGGGMMATAIAIMQSQQPTTSSTEFVWPWILALLISSVINMGMLASAARRRGDSFVSEGMMMAMRSLCPPMAVGGALGFGAILVRAAYVDGALCWIGCYGLALLSTRHFAPRSIKRLGYLLLAATLLFAAWSYLRPLSANDAPTAAMMLGLCFGGLHLVYAIAVFLHRSPTNAPLPE